MLLEKTLPLLFLFLIGYFLKKKDILHRQNGKILGSILLYIVIPAIVINALSNVPINNSLLILPLIAFILVSLLLGSGYLLSWILRLKGKRKSSFILCFPTLEGGSIGYSFMLIAFGTIGLSKIVVFDLGNSIFLYTIIFPLASFLGESKKDNLQKHLARFVQNPIIWALFIGILLDVLHIHFDLLSNFLTVTGSALLLLVSVLLGLEFEFSIKSFRFPLLNIILKTCAGLCLGLFLSFLFNLHGIDRATVLIASTLPPSILNIVLATDYALDIQYTADLLPLAILIGVLFTSLFITFLK